VPRILATAIATPPHPLTRADVHAWAERLWPGTSRAAAVMRLADGTGIDQRQLIAPVEQLLAPRPFSARNREYERAAVELGLIAARRALDRAQLDGAQIDELITTSCTGLLIPSLEAYLAPRLGLRSDVVRLPITELGCAAGAAALARAREHLLAFPDRRVMVLAVEITSITFQLGDHRMTNLVAGSIFGDGAAAAILGDGRGRPGPELFAARSHLYPDSRHLMGFRVGDEGLEVVLDREVPAFLSGKVLPLVEALCRAHGLSVAELRFAAIHPGGRKILANLERELALPRAATEPSWEVLRDHGNMSSATVLYVLDRLWRSPPPPGSHGLLAAFGPGFAAELGLMRWEA
jgi:alkylresorcinol/alkylpyrone synthase